MPDSPVRNAQPEESQLRWSDYTQPVVDRLLLIVAAVVLAATATYVYESQKPEIYASSTSIFLTSTNPNPLTDNGFGVDDRTTLSQATLLTTRGVAVRVARALGFAGGPDPLLGAVMASPTEGSDFIIINTQWGTGRGAADIANAFAREFILTRSAQQRDSTRRLLDQLRDQLEQITPTQTNAVDRANLEAQIRQLQLALQLPTSGASQVDPARPSLVPISPKPRRNAIFVGLLALLAAVALAYGLDRFDRRIRRAEDVAEAYGLPMLSAVPHVVQFGEGGRAPAGFVEAFRLLQTNLRLAQIDRPVRVVVVVSAVPGEGKSTVVRYLAEAFSEWGKTVAVVDADLRRPSLTRLYGVDGEEGLTDLVGSDGPVVLSEGALVAVDRPKIGGSGALVAGEQAATPTTDEAQFENSLGTVAQMTVARDGERALPGSERAPIHVLAAGTAPPNPAALLAATRTRLLIEEVSADHDLVIMDTPPVLAVSDAMALVPLADAVIIVSRVGKTTRDEAERLIDALRRIPDAQLVGIVANDVVAVDEDRYGYYDR